MGRLAPKLAAAIGALAVLLALAAPALAAPHFDGSFKVAATGANNVKMVAGPDGNVWMTDEGAVGKDVARITPSGTVTEYDLPGVEKPGGIAVGPEGSLWVTQKGGVARFSPADPTSAVTTKAFPVSAGIEEFASIVTGPDSQLWVATKALVVHFQPSDPTGTKVEVKVENLAPHDIDVAGQLLVVADSAMGRIVTVSTAGTVGKVGFVNNPTGTSQGVAGSPGGQFAFSESDGKEGLAIDTPPNPATAELRGVGDPFGVARGSDGVYYFAMAGEDDVRRLVPGASSIAIGGFPKEFFPRQITAGANNTMWVAMEIPGKNTVEVARISGLEPPTAATANPPPPSPSPPLPKPPALPETTLGKLPKKTVKTAGETAQVRFTFSSTTAGAGFECSLGRRVKPKGKKARFVGQAFKDCKSPRTYTLKPGRYRFQVRAVVGSARDASPARYAFKVVHAAAK